MAVSLDLAVKLLHAMEERFGTEAREVVREMARRQEFPVRPDAGDPKSDLGEFCSMVDRAAAGSHRWQRLIDEPGKIGYHYTRCMYAEILGELGEPELGLVICVRDKPWVKAYHSGLEFHRTKTLMEGDTVCDHVFSVGN